MATTGNIHHEILIRYSNLNSQSDRKYDAIGNAIRHESMTSMTKLRVNKVQRLNSDAPTTFRMPISLVRCSATKEERPNKPSRLMRIARPVKIDASFPTRNSEANFMSYSSSTNLY